MVWPHPRLLLITVLISFCSNWQFAYQITYVNTSVKTFYSLANEGFQNAHGCKVCWLPTQSWSSAWSSIVSSFYPGAILGFLMTPSLTSRFGVKRTQILTCMAAILGCSVHFLAKLTVQTTFQQTLNTQFTLCCENDKKYYFQEVVLEKRGTASRFSQYFPVSQATGTLLGLLIGTEDMVPLGENRFIWLQVFAVAPTILFVLVLSLTPKTPHQLVKEKATPSKLTKCIAYYHGMATPIEEVKKECGFEEVPIPEKNAAENDSACTQSTTARRRPKWSSWKGFMIGSAAAISYAFTADDLVDTFSSQIIASSTGDSNEKLADIVSVALGGVLLISSLFGTVLVDHFGRRRLILFGLMGTAISNAFVVAFPTSFGVVTGAFTLTKAFIGLGAGAPAWFLTSELVEPAYVSLFQSMSTGLLLVGTMVVTFFFLQLQILFGNYSILILASGPSVILSIILFLFLPETKDKTHAEVLLALEQNTFSGIVKPKARVSPIYGTL